MPVWLDLQSGTGSAFYLIGGYLRIKGTIDAARLARAIGEVIEGCDALRLGFHPRDPQQFFASSLAVPLRTMAVASEEAFLSFIAQDFTRPVDLDHGPLFDFMLARTKADLSFLLFRFHHLLVDGHAIRLVIRAIAAAYDNPGHKAEAFPSYRRFIAEDAAYRSSPRHTGDLDYWRERLRNLPDPLFPVRTPAPRFPAPSIRWWVDWPDYQRFLDTTHAHDVTPFQALSGLLAALMARHTGSRDLVLGVPILNRPGAVFKQTIGMFTGLMPLRLAFDPRERIPQWLERVGEQLRQDYRHQRVSIHEILHALRLGQRRLFDVALSYEKSDYDFP
ncbi:MAG TPA: condensation domain-containing protein, partial [Stellaceae bacterium]|nr:condensation domain-containing protein [Stellaceae bacterium]